MENKIEDISHGELQSFLLELNIKRKEHFVQEFSATYGGTNYEDREFIAATVGPKFIKIVRVSKEPGYTGHRLSTVITPEGTAERYVCAVFCFLDKQGNILKASGFNAPAKGVRGNIRGDWWLKAITPYGAAYLR
jgi:hypothetical protein